MYDLNAPDTRALAGEMLAGFEAALAARVSGLPSHVKLVDYAMRTGHRTRPVGCLLGCAAVGGDWKTALDAAIAVELVHKSSVIRDDVVDDDEVRSGQRALHVVYGTSAAIAVSDLLWTLALRDAATMGEACTRAFAEALHDMAAGQLEDVAPSADAETIEGRVLVEERKTGALSQLACRVGAIAGGGEPYEVDALARYGRALGTAFQLLNDVRNLKGIETGRSAASDIRKRRDNVLSAYARTTAPAPDRQLLESIRLGSGDLSDAKVEAVRETIMASGAPQFCEETAVRLMTDARAQLKALGPTPARDILESLTQDALLAYAF